MKVAVYTVVVSGRGAEGEGKIDQSKQMEISLDFGYRRLLYHPLLRKKSTFSKTSARC